jgi:hypothetical protein
MENALVNNTRFVDTEEGIEIIEQLFKDNCPDYIMKKKYNFGGFYGFGIIIEKENVEIMLGSERGSLEVSLKISDKYINLREYDERLKYVGAASRENFLFVFSIIINFLSELKEDVDDKYLFNFE